MCVCVCMYVCVCVCMCVCVYRVSTPMRLHVRKCFNADVHLGGEGEEGTEPFPWLAPKANVNKSHLMQISLPDWGVK